MDCFISVKTTHLLIFYWLLLHLLLDISSFRWWNIRNLKWCLCCEIVLFPLNRHRHIFWKFFSCFFHVLVKSHISFFKLHSSHSIPETTRLLFRIFRIRHIFFSFSFFDYVLKVIFVSNKLSFDIILLLSQCCIWTIRLRP